jgi:photosynthetic reaction center H subunit
MSSLRSSLLAKRTTRASGLKPALPERSVPFDGLRQSNAFPPDPPLHIGVVGLESAARLARWIQATAFQAGLTVLFPVQSAPRLDPRSGYFGDDEPELFRSPGHGRRAGCPCNLLEVMTMQVGAITGYIDVAQVALYAFWIFFAGLIFYLRGEDRREGYPLVNDGGPPEATPANAVAIDSYPGSALTPVGNPLLAGIGPGSWAPRADEPDLTYEDKIPKIAPLRVATGYYLAPEGPDPRGYALVAADGVVAGEVVDIWVDRNELLVRFFEVETPVAGVPRRVLVPGPMATVDEGKRTVKVESIVAAQLADVPRTKHPDQITRIEEDYVSAYYGAGTLYATPERLGPLI